MFCHGELARLRPDPRYLTRFYLMISVGGALGAVLVAIVAPLALHGYFEARHRTRAAGAAGAAAAEGPSAHRRAGRRRGHGVLCRARRLRLRQRAARDGARLLRRGAHARHCERRCRIARCSTAASCTAGSCSATRIRNTPSDYFGPGSGYGRLFAALQRAVSGAAAGRHHRTRRRGCRLLRSTPGDRFTFYEIRRAWSIWRDPNSASCATRRR